MGVCESVSEYERILRVRVLVRVGVLEVKLYQVLATCSTDSPSRLFVHANDVNSI